jgi:hypothetical protein
MIKDLGLSVSQVCQDMNLDKTAVCRKLFSIDQPAMEVVYLAIEQSLIPAWKRVSIKYH